MRSEKLRLRFEIYFRYADLICLLWNFSSAVIMPHRCVTDSDGAELLVLSRIFEYYPSRLLVVLS